MDQIARSTHTISNINIHSTLAHFTIQLSPTLHTKALFDTGTSCSCISQSLFDHLLEDNNIKVQLQPMNL